jgi:epsilon-lactone hydrolase
MSETADRPRRFSAPASISPQAQATLSVELPETQRYPAAGDLAGWRLHVERMNAELEHFSAMLEPRSNASARREEIAGVPVVVASPTSRHLPADRVILDMHGGGLVFMGGHHVEPWSRFMATRTGADVVSPDYRMPPDHPYPAPLDDCLAVYRELVVTRGAANVIVSGESAGGNLAAALVLKARDAQIPLPRGLILLSPELDLTESGDTFQTLLGVDHLQPLMPVNTLYAGVMPLDHPYVSPLFGDFRPGFPPTFLQSGTRDLFLSNTVRMHRALRKAGIRAELHVWEAMPHGMFLGDVPENQEIDEEIRRFLDFLWP